MICLRMLHLVKTETISKTSTVQCPPYSKLFVVVIVIFLKILMVIYFQGDSTIYAYEVGTDYPHLFPLSHHKAGSVHQVSHYIILFSN